MGLFYSVKNGNYYCHICNRIFKTGMSWRGHRDRNKFHKEKFKQLIPIYNRIKELTKLIYGRTITVEQIVSKMGFNPKLIYDKCLFCQLDIKNQALIQIFYYTCVRVYFEILHLLLTLEILR